MNSIAIIKESNILSVEDNSKLMDLISNIEESFATAQVFRTDTEMRVSVLNDLKHPTYDSKYWQAVREQDVHATELASLSYEYRKKDVEIRKLQKQLQSEEDELERELLQIEIEQTKFHKSLMERQAHHRVREVAAWAQIKEELKPLMKHGTEDVNQHQLESMSIRFTNEAKLVNNHTPPADARNILGLADMAKKMSR